MLAHGDAAIRGSSGRSVWSQRKLTRAVTAAVVFTSLGVASRAEAASQVWSTTADGNWADSVSWVGGTVPGITSGTNSPDIAIFSSISNAYAVTTDANRNISGFTFDLTAGPAAGYTIGGSGVPLLLSDGGAILGALTSLNTGFSTTLETINAPLVLEGSTYTIANFSAVTPLEFFGTVTGSSASNTTLTLTGSNNNFSDSNGKYNVLAGVVSNGSGHTLAISQVGTGIFALFNANTYTGGTSIVGGTLNLDFSQNLATNDIITNSSQLTLAGALGLIGSSSASNTQTFGNTILGPGALVLMTNSGSKTVQVAFGNVTRHAAGTINFALPANGLTASNGYTVANTNTNGILGGWATVGGTDWAQNNGTNVAAVAGYMSDAWASGNNTTVTLAANTITGGTTNTLRFASGVADVVTLSGTNAIATGGIMVSSAQGAVASTITGGTLQGASGDGLYIHQFNTGSLTIGSQITDNGSATALVKVGTGTGVTFLTNPNNNYTGGIYIAGGVLNFVSGALGSAGPITFAGGVAASNASFGSLQYATGNKQDISARLVGNNLPIRIDTNGNNVIFGNGLASSNTGGLVKSGLGSLTLGGASNYTGNTTLNGGSVIVGNPTALGNSNNTVFFTSASNANILDLATDTPVTSYNVLASSSFVIASDLATPGPGMTQTLGSLGSTGGVVWFVGATAGPNVTGGSPVVAFGPTTLSASYTNANNTFVPTTANLNLSSITGEANGFLNTLTLSGLSQNNVINGAISNGPNAGYVAVTKINPSTWTLAAANTMSTQPNVASQTSIQGGTLIVTNNLAFQNTHVQVTSAAGFNGILKLESNTPTTFTTQAINFANSTAPGFNFMTGTATVDVDPQTSGSGGTILTLSNMYYSSASQSWFNVTSANNNNYTLGITTFAQYNSASATAILNPTTGNLAIGTLADQVTGGGSGGSQPMILGGSSTGNTLGSIGVTGTNVPLYKIGSGTWTLNGSVGTYGYTGGTNIYAGTLKEDLSQQMTTTTGLLPSTALSLGNGTFSLNGSTSVLVSQSFAGSILTVGGAGKVVATTNGFGTQINLGGITRGANQGGTVDFTLPSGTQSLTNGVTTTAVNVNGIIGGYATVGGTDWATSAATALTGQSFGSNTITGTEANNTQITLGATAFGGLTANTTYYVVNSNGANFHVATTLGGTALTLTGSGTGSFNIPGNITAYTGYTDIDALGGVIVNASTSNVRINTSTGGGSTVTLGTQPTTVINSLLYKTATNATVDLNGGSLSIGSGGIFIPSGAGTLTLGLASGSVGNINSSGSELIVNNQSGNPVTMNSKIIVAGDVIVTGGPVTFTNAGNTYGGGTGGQGTYITGRGLLNVSADLDLGTAPGSALQNVNLDDGTLQLGASFDLNANRKVFIYAGGGTIDTQGFNMSIPATAIITSVANSFGNFTKTGSGTLTLLGTANTIAGRIYIKGGTLNIAGDVSLGNVPGSVLSDDINFINGSTLQFGGAFTLAQVRGITIDSAGATFDTQANADTIAGIISGTGGFTKVGSGTLTLEVANLSTTAQADYNSFSGPVAIQAGTVKVNAIFNNGAGGVPQPLGEGTSAIVLGNATTPTNSAVLQYDNAQTAAVGNQTVLIQQMATPILDRSITVAAGDTATVLNTAPFWPLALNNATISVGNGLTLGGSGTAGTAGIVVGDQITGANGGLTVNAATSVTLNNATNNYNGSTVVSGASTLKNGVTNATSPNSALSLGAADNSNGTYDLAGFSSTVGGLTNTGSGVASVTNNGFTNAVLTVSNSSSNYSYGGTITDGANATTALAKSGSKTLTLGVANTYSGGTTVSAGLLVASTGVASVGSGDVTMNGGEAIFRGTSTTTIFNMIYSGFNSSSGYWNGHGINSTSAANDLTDLTAVGMMQPTSATTFYGQPLGTGDVAVKYTYYGDANLDGHVDGTDYSLIDTGYASQSTMSQLTGWQNGDFNYDGHIDGSDYSLIDNTFNMQSMAGYAAQIASNTSEIAQLAGTSSVPEPATLGLFGIGAVGLLGRRSRRFTRHH